MCLLLGGAAKELETFTIQPIGNISFSITYPLEFAELRQIFDVDDTEFKVCWKKTGTPVTEDFQRGLLEQQPS
jgi:hypothetical protein